MLGHALLIVVKVTGCIEVRVRNALGVSGFEVVCRTSRTASLCSDSYYRHMNKKNRLRVFAVV